MTDLAVLSIHTPPLAQLGWATAAGSTSTCASWPRRSRRRASPPPSTRAAGDLACRTSSTSSPGSPWSTWTGARRASARRTSPACSKTSPARCSRPSSTRPDALFAHYWLSGVVGHQLKHVLDLPLITTFHTLARVKGDGEPELRARSELEVIGCAATSGFVAGRGRPAPGPLRRPPTASRWSRQGGPRLLLSG